MNLARMMIAIGCVASLTGCHACWLDRADDRPQRVWSLRDKFDYWTHASCGDYRPWYHCGHPDGFCDRKAVRHAAITSANRTLNDDCAGGSRDFRLGFQQAFIDIANGGDGTMPAVPPSRYWSAAYRTTWGHNKAREWFEGYRTGANAANAGALQDARSIPTTACRSCDRRMMGQWDGGQAARPNMMPDGPMMSPMPAPAWNSSPMAPYGQSAPPHSSGWMPPMWSPNSPTIMPQPGMPPVPASSPNWGPNDSPQWSPPTSGHSITPPSIPSGPIPSHTIAPPPEPAAQNPTNNPWQQFSGFGTGEFDATRASRAIVDSSPLNDSAGGHSAAPSPNMVPTAARPQSAPTHNPWDQFTGFGASRWRGEGALR